ncbi:MAG: helix-turn-helix transcriptional regulator [Clostridia bacterium]|nr:helix-turn-helix transcriptional regulator [Clostridia bacterium]
MNDLSFGALLKKERQEKGLSQRQLAEIVGVSSAVISQYEKDLRMPKYETRLKYAQALGISVSKFISNADEAAHEADTKSRPAVTAAVTGGRDESLIIIIPQKLYLTITYRNTLYRPLQTEVNNEQKTRKGRPSHRRRIHRKQRTHQDHDSR